MSKQNTKASKSSTKSSKRKASAAPVEAPEKPASKPAKVKGKKPAPAASKPAKGKRKALPVETTAGEGGTFRYTLYGLAITSILRWYGSKGYKPRAVLAALNAGRATPLTLSPTTVGIQVAAGSHGEGNPRGPIPELTREQERELLAALES